MNRHKLNALQRQALEYEDLIFTEKGVEADNMMRERLMEEVKNQEQKQAQERAQKAQKYLQEKERREKEREKNFPDIGSW